VEFSAKIYARESHKIRLASAVPLGKKYQRGRGRSGTSGFSQACQSKGSSEAKGSVGGGGGFPRGV